MVIGSIGLVAYSASCLATVPSGPSRVGWGGDLLGYVVRGNLRDVERDRCLTVPSVTPHALRRTHASGYLIRFGFGGSMTALAGIIAHAYGPAIGGLFLAFPVILPASLTLVASHDGRQSAVEEAWRAILGAVGLGAFATSVWFMAGNTAPALAVTVAAAAWFVISFSLWWMFDGRRAS